MVALDVSLLGQALRLRGATVTCAESCTGGAVAAALTSAPGSSAWFERSWVTYSNQAKTEELGVPTDLLHRYGAVSEAVVLAMATGAQRRAVATWSVAVSGIAGPDGGSPGKPVGTVWIAWLGPGMQEARCFLFKGGRAEVRRQALEMALTQLQAMIGAG